MGCNLIFYFNSCEFPESIILSQPINLSQPIKKLTVIAFRWNGVNLPCRSSILDLNYLTNEGEAFFNPTNRALIN